MKKLIEISPETKMALTLRAVKKGMSLFKFIELLLIKEAQNE